MSTPKLLPIEPLRISSENHRSFTHIARFTEERSSFYLSFGAALLQSLIRMKLCPKFGEPAWAKLIETIEAATRIAKEYNSEYAFLSFRELVLALKNTNIEKAREWLVYFLENNYQEAVVSLDIGIRCLLASLKDLPPYVRNIMDNSPFDLQEQKLVLTRVLEVMRLYIMIVSKYEEPIISDSAIIADENLLICLYKDQDEYYIVYDSKLKQVWETCTAPPEGIEAFPFTHRPPSRTSVNEGESVSQSIRDLINILANRTMNSRSNDPQLREAVAKAIAEHPILNTSDLKELHNRLT